MYEGEDGTLGETESQKAENDGCDRALPVNLLARESSNRG